MSEERSGLERLVRRVRNGLGHGRQTLARKIVPITAARSTRAARRRNDERRPRPYLEALEPRVLLSADVGLVPEALLAPPADSFDPRALVEPEIHDDVLVREPNRFEKVARQAFVQTKTKEAQQAEIDLGGQAARSGEESVDTAASGEAEAKPPEDGNDAPAPDATGEGAANAPADSDPAARALKTRVWQASLVEELAQSTVADQVIVVDARIPDVDSLLEALLEGVGGDIDAAYAEWAQADGDAEDDASEGGPGDSLEATAGSSAEGRLLAGDDLFGPSEEGATNRAASLASALEAKGVAVVVLDGSRDGLEQLGEIARAYQGVGAMHVVSHGGRGTLSLGSSRVTTEMLRARAGMLAGLRDALGEDGDLLLYGCEVAGGEVGIEFVSTLAELAGVDVAASTDLTGAAAFGGDWDLEFSTGTIEASAIQADGFEGVLRTFTLPDDTTALSGDVTISFVPGTGTDPGAWHLSLSGGAAFIIDGDTATSSSEIDLLGADEAVTITLNGTSATADVSDTINLVLDGSAATEDFTGAILVDGQDGDDQLSVSGSSERFTGGITLEGGDGSDTFDFTALENEADLNFITVTDRGVGATDSDEILYAGLIDEADRANTTAGQIESVNVDALLDVDTIVAALEGLRDDMAALGESGEFALALAGVRGNVDVTVGGAIDFGQAFDQLIVAVQAEGDTLDAESLQTLLAGFAREGEDDSIEYLDRALTGDVVERDGIDSSGVGFTVQLDDGDVIRFGVAAGETGVAGGVLIGDATLTFRRAPNDDRTVRRATGGWKAEGFREGQTIRFAGELTADTTDTVREFEIDSISGDDLVLTLKAKTESTFVADFDALLDDDGDSNTAVPTERTGVSAAEGSVSVANTVYIGETGDSFEDAGFRANQKIQAALDDGTSADWTAAVDLTIESVSEDGRVLIFTPESAQLPTPGATESVVIRGTPFDATSAGTLSGLSDAINTVIGESEIAGQLTTSVIDVGADRGRLVFRVTDVNVASFELEATGGEDVLGFSGTNPLENLTEELSSLGDLEVRVSGPAYEATPFNLEQTNQLSIVGANASETFGVGDNVRLTFSALEGGRGTLTRDSGVWDAGFADDTVVLSGTTNGNDGTYRVIPPAMGTTQPDTVLILERALVLSKTEDGARTITRAPGAGSWLAEGFTPDATVTLTALGGTEITATISSVDAGVLTITGVEADLDELATGQSTAATFDDEPLVATILDAAPVGLVYDATANTFTYTFRYSGDRTSEFNVDLGSQADENGIKFASDVKVDLEASFESELTLVVDVDGSQTASADVGDMTASVDVNTPESAIADLPVAGETTDRSDLARAVFTKNIAGGSSSDIGFLGAEISDDDAGTSMDGYVALRADLEGTGTDSGDYSAETFLSLDLPIQVKDGIGFTPDAPIRISSLNSEGATTFSAFDVGSALEGRDAFADEAIFQGFDGNVTSFANIDARGFVRLLGEIRTGFQRVNDSEIISQFDIPLIKDGLGALTDLANAFGNAVLYDDGGDGLDRDNQDALVRDLNKKLEDAGLEELVEFRVVTRELGAAGEELKTFDLVAIDQSVTSLTIARGTSGTDPFFGIADGTVTTRTNGVLKLAGTAEFDPSEGKLTVDQSTTITVGRSFGQPIVRSIGLTVGETSSNTTLGNDQAKLLDADNAPTFATAQELKDKLIELAVSALDIDQLSYNTADGRNELLFKIDLDQNLFAQEFEVDFDLDLSPVGSIQTTGQPKIRVSGDLGFSIEFGIDLRDSPAGASPIDANTQLEDLRNINELSDLIKTSQSVTARGDGVVEVLNTPDAPPEEAGIDIEIDRVRMAAGTALTFGSVDFVTPSAERLTGDKLQIVAPSGYEIQLFQESFGDRLTDNSLQQQSLLLDRALLSTTPLEYASEISGILEFDFAVREEGDLPPRTTAEDTPETTDPRWVHVVVDAGAGIDVSSRAGRAEYVGLVQAAIASAQNARVSNTITRTAGSFLSEGFGARQMIEIQGAGSNNGFYEITDATASTLTVRQGLDPASGVGTAQIEGPGTIAAPGDATALGDFAVGEQIQIVGSARNDGTYVVFARDPSGRLVLSSELEPEPASDEIELISEGSSIRLERPDIPDDATETEIEQAEEAAAARFDIELEDGTLYGIVIYADEIERDAFAPNTADNRSPNDLLQDLRGALGRAIEGGLDSGGEVVDLTEEDRANGFEAGLDGTRLVITRVGDNDTTAFSLSSVNANAVSLGFANVDSNLADLRVVLSDGSEGLVAFDGLTTIGQVLAAIEAAFPVDASSPLSGSRVSARVAESGTGLEIVERGQMTGRPRLTIGETDGSTERSFLRSKGSWIDDGFESGQTFDFEGTTYTVEDAQTGDDTAKTLRVSAADAATSTSERIVDGAVITIAGVLFGSDDFRIELINGSVAAAGLGLLRADAAADENEDGLVDGEDADGLIEGDTVGGASLFDRIFIRNPEFTVGLEIAPVENQIDIDARIGFVQADLAAKGGFGANGVFGLEDLPPVDDPDGDPDGYITLREIARGLRTPLDFIATPTFEAGSLDDDFSGVLTASSQTVDGDDRLVIERSVGDWSEDDGFNAGQRITISGFTSPSGTNTPNGTFTISEVRLADENDPNSASQLVLEENPDLGTPSVVLTRGTDGDMVGTFGVFSLELESIGADGFGSISLDDLDVGNDAQVRLTLFDLGDPFFRESMGSATDPNEDGASGPGGTVTLTGLDTFDVTRLASNTQADEIDEALDEVRIAVAAGDVVKVTVVYTDKDGEEQKETRKVTAVSTPATAGGAVTVTLDESLVDDLSDVEKTDDTVELSKITFTKPPKTEIETPDLGSLLDFENISIRDIVRGLQLASDFLGQFEEFAFLDAPIPVIELSFNDLLDFADQLAAGVEEAQADPDGTLQSIERRLEEILGITEDDPFDIALRLVSEDLGGRSVGGEAIASDSHKVLQVDLLLGDGFEETLGVEFDLGDAGVLAGSAGLSASAAGEIAVSLGIDVSETEMRGTPELAFTLGMTSEGATVRQIERRDQLDGGGDVEWSMDGFLQGQTIVVKGTDGRDGRYEILEITGATIRLAGEEGATAADYVDWESTVDLSGVEITGRRSVSLFESTAISAELEARADDVDFRAAVGPLGIYIQDGTVSLNGGLPSGDILRAGLDFDGDDDVVDFSVAAGTNTAGDATRRIVAGEALDRLSDVFAVSVDVDSNFNLPVYFPTDGLLQGRVVVDASISTTVTAAQLAAGGPFEFEVEKSIQAFRGDSTTPLASPTDLFGLDQFDPRDLSLFDNIRLAIDGFDLLLGGIQDVLDGEILGIDLPLIGDSLSDGARFIEDLREDFVEPFRDGIEDAESFVDDLADANKNVISRLLFDELSKTGLLLVTHDRDGNELTDDQQYTARAGQLVLSFEDATDVADYGTIAAESRTFLLSQVVRLNGTRKDSDDDTWFDSRSEEESRGEEDGDIDLAGIPSGQIRDIAFLEWDFRLGQDLTVIDSDIALDFGIPGLGLEADGALGIELGWDLELGFGLDFQDGFYFDIGSESELQIDVDVVLPDNLTGRLAFLQLNAENLDSGLGATFVVDIVNKTDAEDDRLAFTELGKLKLEAGIAAEAKANLGLELKLNEELLADFPNVFPTVLADFEFDWAIGDRAAEEYVSIEELFDQGTSVFAEGLNTVQFTDVNLDLGSFISDFAAPILSEIQKVTGPIQPIVDILTAPLPVVSDLGPPVTLLDLARMTGVFNPALIEAVADIITLVNAIPTDVDTIMIGFGDFVIYKKEVDAEGNVVETGVDPTDKNADFTKESKRQGSNRSTTQSKTTGKSAGFVDKLKNTRGFKFPILSDPTQIFGLLTGDEVVLFGYDMPPLELDFAFTAFYPVSGPLGVGLTGTAFAKIDFAFGFDSSGLQRFLDSGFTNPAVIFDGFFVSDNPEDVTGAGPDLPELQFDLGFFLSAELNLGVARAGVAGGVEAGVDFDLFDPNGDGKVRVGEIIENIENEFLFGEPILSPLAIFDVSGMVTARAFAFLKINLLLLQVDKEFNITPVIKLAEFDVDFTRAPKLGTVLDDGMLQLNMGEFAGERLNGDLRDTGEHFQVDMNGTNEVRVTWVGSNGSGPDFYNDFDVADIAGVLAIAGEGNDTIVIGEALATRANMRYEIHGGSGNDRIIVGSGSGSATGAGQSITSILRGGDGSDEIIGTIGRDQIYGGAGSDLLFGGGGDDVLFGDIEQLVEVQPRVRNMDARISGGGTSFTLTDLDEDTDFGTEGFAAGQTVSLEITRAGADPDAEPEEYLYQVATGGVGTTTLRLASLVSPGGTVEVPTLLEGDLVEVAAQDADFPASYKATSTDSDGNDVVIGGLGNDWILGAGGDDVLIGGDDGIAGTRPTTTPTAYNNSFDTDFSERRDYLSSLASDGSVVEGVLPDAGTIAGSEEATNSSDVILGDGGEIRLDRSGAILTADPEDLRLFQVGVPDEFQASGGGDGGIVYGLLVEGTDRGLAFGDDRIFGGGGQDALYGGRGDDEIFGGNEADVIYGETGRDTIDAEGGRDVVFGGRDDDSIMGAAGEDRLFGEQGADRIDGGTEDDYIYGDAGADLIFGREGSDRISGGADFDLIFGGASRDLIRGDAGDDTIFGEDGNDEITVRGGSDLVSGGSAATGDYDEDDDPVAPNDGDDEFIVDFKGGENSARSTIIGGEGSNKLTVIGTGSADQFLLRSGLATDFVASINADGNVERVDYQDMLSLIVNGGAGDDRYALDDVGATTTLNGGAGDDQFQVGQLYRSLRSTAAANIDPDDQFATVEVTRGFLSNGVSQSTTINGGNDNDTIIVYRNIATLTVNGQAGDDSIEVRAFALVNPLDKLQKETKISGGGGADTIRYAVNAPVNIDGGDGLDSVSVIGTEFGDEFVITESGVFGAGLTVNFTNVELLRIDGAEGDDQFFIESTNADVLTQIVGGLGSDTFQIADGEEHEVISNDLLGHSGLIIHDVDPGEGMGDPAYAGPDGNGIRVNGVSVNVADADEAGIAIRPSDGFSRVTEGGALDWYTVVLTRKPNENVTVRVNAPELSPEGASQGEDLLRIWRDNEGLPQRMAATTEQPDPGRNLVLTFTADDWFRPQRVWVEAVDDGAIEGERFGVIQHKVEGQVFNSGNPKGTEVINAPGIASVVGPEIIDQVVQLDEDGDIVTVIDLEGELDLGEDVLRARLFEISDGPGFGQSLLVKSSETVNVGGTDVTRITLYGVFDVVETPTDASDYRIKMWDGLVIPTVTVQIDDNDAPDVTITPVAGGEDPRDREIVDEIQIFEGDETRSGALEEKPIYRLDLGRAPRRFDVDPEAPTPEVRVQLDVTTASLEDPQLEIALFDPEDPTATPDWQQTLVATFPDGESPVFIQIRSIDEDPGVPEGFHTGFIRHTVLDEIGDADARDLDRFIVSTGETEGADRRVDLDEGEIEADSILLPFTPVQFRGDVNAANGGVTSTTITGFGDVSFSVADLNAALGQSDDYAGELAKLRVRITKGAGAGQIREVSSIDGNTVTVTEAWEDGDEPDETSRFAVYGLEVSVYDRFGNLLETLDLENFELNGNEVVFFNDELIVEPIEFRYALVDYSYLDPGYEGRAEELLPIRIADEDSAGVLILESGGSTDVIEVNETGGPQQPPTRPEGADDSYQVVLSRQPTEDVVVTVQPRPTVTSRGDVVNPAAIQVEIRAGDDDFTDEPITLTFTAENWDTPQTVFVRAVSDGLVDGGDTKVFAPYLRTLSEIRGPLLVDGAGGRGSLEGLAPPVMLPLAPDAEPTVGDVVSATPTTLVVRLEELQQKFAGDSDDPAAFFDPRDLLGREIAERIGDEAGTTRTILEVSTEGTDVTLTVDAAWDATDPATIDGFEVAAEGESNRKRPTGSVRSVEVDRSGPEARTFVTVPEAEITRYLGRFALEELAGSTLEIVRGEGIDQFREIIRATMDATGENVIIEVAPEYDLRDDQLGGVIAYAITNQSLNFFVNEADSRDMIFVHDDDSPANSAGAMTDLSFADYPSMESIFNGSLLPDDEDYVVPNRLIGFGMGGDVEIARGTRPGGITYSNFEGFELTLGYGNNQLLVDTVHERSDLQTFTRILAGRGNDVVDVSLQNEANDGGKTPWVQIDVGDGDDVINASDFDESRYSPALDREGAPLVLGETTIALELIGGFGRDMITGGAGDDLIFGDFGTLDFSVADSGALLAVMDEAEEPRADVEARSPVVEPIVETTRIEEGDDDVLEGRGGNDRIFGGAGDDAVRGGDDEDILFGDYGKVSRSDTGRTIIETTALFLGGADSVDGGAGGDFIFGGFGADALFGNLRDDLLVGEYARLNLIDGIGQSIVRLGQGNLDLAASTFFGLYDPRFGPLADFILPEQRAATEDLAVRPSIDVTEDRAGGLADAESALRRLGSVSNSPPVMPYDVASGDTLWDIAESELGDPYRWTEIYDLSRDEIADPNRIEPEEHIRIPGRRALTPAEIEAQQGDMAALRERLEGLDVVNSEAAEEGWGFFNPLAVGAGPPEAADELPSSDEVPSGEGEDSPDAAVDPTRDDRGTMRDAGDDQHLGDDADPELSGLILASLVGWRKSMDSPSARRRGKWLRFDADAGRFA